MKYRDTRDASRQVSFTIQGMDPETGGLYIPVQIPGPAGFVPVPQSRPLSRDIAFEAAKPFVSGEIPDAELMAIIADAYPFTAPIAPIDPTTGPFHPDVRVQGLRRAVHGADDELL